VAVGEPLAPQAIAGLLASLAGKSLVQIQAGPVTRYWLLEPVRQFAADRLTASGGETAVHGRLLQWALEVARSADAALSSAEWTGWSDRLSAEQASIRAALSWALGGAEPETGRELAALLARVRAMDSFRPRGLLRSGYQQAQIFPAAVRRAICGPRRPDRSRGPA